MEYDRYMTGVRVTLHSVDMAWPGGEEKDATWLWKNVWFEEGALIGEDFFNRKVYLGTMMQAEYAPGDPWTYSRPHLRISMPPYQFNGIMDALEIEVA